jgi:hypothetical protein
VFLYLKYFYFRQLRHTFEYGSVFRRATSSTEAGGNTDMHFSWGPKPAINAAAAVNPDGSWGIGLINNTGTIAGNQSYFGGEIGPEDHWYYSQYYPTDVYDVTVSVEDLASLDGVRLQVVRSNAAEHEASDGYVVTRGGAFTVRVNPHELITLRTCQ